MNYGQRKNSFVWILLTVELAPQSQSSKQHGDADDDEAGFVADLQCAGDVGGLCRSECDALPVLQAERGVRGAGGGHADNERHLASPCAGTSTVSKREVTICMELVNDETFTVTG